uniref:ATP synthase complex subunit 8 n=2 Tax=Pandalidae TaxID=6701 RepID=A0A5P8DQY7_9EUCA|nr:ATP synthase F0 subunit 8 [Heterocarpus ensifer]YP_010703293.1 ATP synthase F0 subunit 8 [Heterocarpus sibogae]QBA19609.1 ATP synthase F0 subunit 8 [Heterocarpus ensifer]QFQ01360.1 ATP synthase F0 subunit 8 [Parapandalus sp. SS-2019]WCO11496.1 ATP synthase F0 subunit 8 [Heterocarpus sibogae]
MPQMAPLMWLNLFGFFSLVFMFFLISNYFIKPPVKMEAQLKPLSPSRLNWKW